MNLTLTQEVTYLELAWLCSILSKNCRTDIIAVLFALDFFAMLDHITVSNFQNLIMMFYK